MAYISPNSTLRILHGVPLSIENTNSINFASRNQQEAYFTSKAKYTYEHYSYIDEGVVRVETCADNLYDCNYLMFINRAYGNKYFYAFITSINWINNVTTEITYVIDYLQTWLFDFTYKPCMIERMHTPTDSFGDSLTAEPFTLDDYVYNSYHDLDLDTTELVVVIGFIYIPSGGTAVAGKLYDGLYGGLTYIAFESTDVNGINTFLSQFNANPENVVSMYVVPKVLTDYIQGMVYGQAIPQSDRGYDLAVELNGLNFEHHTIDGYTPKNKKLFTYPYNFLRIDNGSQESMTLRYEYFANPEEPWGRISGTFQGEPELEFRPVSYRSLLTRTGNEDVLTMTDYPELSWNNDSFIQWKTVNKIANNQQMLNASMNIAKGIYSITTGEQLNALSVAQAKKQSTKNIRAERGQISKTGAIIDTATQAVNDVLTIADSWYQASLMADQVRGRICNSSALLATKRKGYHQARMSVRYEQAVIIDNFFSMFGYSIQKVDTPNRANRPHWTFIKTGNCIVTGNIPTDAKAYIEARHNAGITWWANASEYGDYTLDNSPV